MPTNDVKLALEQKELKEALLLLFLLGQAVDKSINDEDGKITAEDLPNFFAVLPAIVPGIMGLKNIPVELRMQTPEEGAKFKEWVRTTFDITDDKVEGAIEEGIGLLVDLYKYFITYIIKNQIPVDNKNEESGVETEGTTDNAQPTDSE